MGVSCSNVSGTGFIPSLGVSPPLGGGMEDEVLSPRSKNHNSHAYNLGGGSCSSSSSSFQLPSTTITCSLEGPVVVVTPKASLTSHQHKLHTHNESLFSSGTVSLAEFGPLHDPGRRATTMSTMVDIVTGSAFLKNGGTSTNDAHCSFGDSVDSRLPSRRQSHACGAPADDVIQQQHTYVHRRRSSSTDISFSVAVASPKCLSCLNEGHAEDGPNNNNNTLMAPVADLSCPLFPNARADESASHALPQYPPLPVSEKLSAGASQRGLEMSESSHLYLGDSHSQNKATYTNDNTNTLTTSPKAHSAELLPPLPHVPAVNASNHTTTTTPNSRSPVSCALAPAPNIYNSHRTNSACQQHRIVLHVVSPLNSYHGSPVTTSPVGQLVSCVSSSKKAGRLYEALQSGASSSCVASGSITPKSVPPSSTHMDDDSGDALGDDVPSFDSRVFSADAQDSAVCSFQQDDIPLQSLPDNQSQGAAVSSAHSSFTSIQTTTSSRRIRRKEGVMTPGTPAKPFTNPHVNLTDVEGISFTNNANPDIQLLTETVIEVERSYGDSCDSAGGSMLKFMVPSSVGRFLCKSGGGDDYEALTPLSRSEMHYSESPNLNDEDDNPLGGSAMPLAVSSSSHPRKASCSFGSQIDDYDESNPLGTSYHKGFNCEDDEDCSDLDDRDDEDEEEHDDEDGEGVDSSLLKRLRRVGDSPTICAAHPTVTAAKRAFLASTFPSDESTYHDHNRHGNVTTGSPPHEHTPHRGSNDSASTKIVVVAKQRISSV